MARLLPVRRTTFVIGTDRTVLKVVSTEVRASVHADQTLWFLQNLNLPHVPPQGQGKHADTHQHVEAADKPLGDLFTEPETPRKPSLVRPYALTAGRTDADVELPLEVPVQAVAATAKSPHWPKNDVRGQILACCVRSRSVAEIAAQLSLPLGATRYLVGDLVTQGYLRVNATPGDSMSIEERRELLTRTLRGLRALST